MPLTETDERYFGKALVKERDELTARGVLKERRSKWFLSASISYPAQISTSAPLPAENYSLIDTSTGALLETVESGIAFFQIHPGAVYLHQGETYLITKLDLATHTAYCNPAQTNYYTQTKELTDLHILRHTAHQRNETREGLPGRGGSDHQRAPVIKERRNSPTKTSGRGAGLAALHLPDDGTVVRPAGEDNRPY